MIKTELSNSFKMPTGIDMYALEVNLHSHEMNYDRIIRIWRAEYNFHGISRSNAYISIKGLAAYDSVK